MQVNIRQELAELNRKNVLSRLLIDRTTGDNILWNDVPMQISDIENIKPFFQRQKELSAQRTKQYAEVVTPRKITTNMCDLAEENINKDLDLLTATVLEITCGEAPFLVNRYDIETGEIIPIEERKGLLDRKLKVAQRQAKSVFTFIELSKAAYKSTYAYELQGDNLLLARLNLFMTFFEYLQHYYRFTADIETDSEWLVKVIVWNVFQLDGLKGTIPNSNKRVKIIDWKSNQIGEFPVAEIQTKRKRVPI